MAAAQTSAAGAVAAFEAVNGTVQWFTMSSYGDFFETFIAPNTDVSRLRSCSKILSDSPQPVARPQAMASRLIPADTFTNEELIDSLADGLITSDFGQILVVPPYAFQGYEQNATSINPAWRTAVWHVSTLSF